ncbi:MAG: DUF4956 domain-containing protein [Clostridia bacterium]|nr:DUF4956 domain-containing protein [Clostridia bacterium]
MNELFNNILTDASEITLVSAITAMVLSLVLGGAIAFSYFKTAEQEKFQRSMALTLVMLPAILTVIILFVGSNVARAFSLAGTLSIIRFRSAPGDAKDIAYIFFDIAAGLSCGVGLYGYGALFVIILCAVIAVMEKTKLFTQHLTPKTLKIAVPETLNFTGAFDEILRSYAKSYKLSKIKTTDLGSLFELTYTVYMEKGKSEYDFINELRTRNGNLTVMLCDAPAAER